MFFWIHYNLSLEHYTGFLGHMATLGCSKCLKEFQGNVGSKNYSGFNRLLGTPRKNELHRSAIKSISQCSNKTERQKMESHYGCKYSALLKLPYFDPICMVSLDPMHNLFLGTAKYVMKNIWIKENILTNQKFSVMQELHKFHVPSNIGANST